MTNPNEKKRLKVVRGRAGAKKVDDLFAEYKKDHPFDEAFDTIQRLNTPTTPVAEVAPAMPPTPVAPVKNYQKVPNSIVKEAIPQGLFKSGKTKLLYDVLYSITRGAIKPTRTVQISKPDLMAKSNIGAMVTLNACISNLQIVGLLKVAIDQSGQHGGNIYEVLTPDELTPLAPPSPPSTGQNLAEVGPVETSPTYTGLSVEREGKYDNPKTSFKTLSQTFDDEKKPVWLNSEVIEVLEMEYRIAEARTDVVSKPPSFFAKHLRNRLFKKTKEQLEVEKGIEIKTNKLDITACPECHGAVWYYPNGFENGVERCRHEKLKTGD